MRMKKRTSKRMRMYYRRTSRCRETRAPHLPEWKLAVQSGAFLPLPGPRHPTRAHTVNRWCDASSGGQGLKGADVTWSNSCPSVCVGHRWKFVRCGSWGVHGTRLGVFVQCTHQLRYNAGAFLAHSWELVQRLQWSGTIRCPRALKRSNPVALQKWCYFFLKFPFFSPALSFWGAVACAV